MAYRRNYYLLLFILFGWISCIQEIPFENKSDLNRINISGQFTDILDNQIIEIREVSNLHAESTVVGNPIESAIVSVEDNNGLNIPFKYAAQGKYIARAKGIIGNAYKLHVKTKDGKTYESSFHKLIKNTSIDSLRAEPYLSSIINTNGTVIQDKRVAVNISTTLYNGQESINTLYRITGEHEFQEEDIRIAPLRVCFITQNFDYGNIVAFSGKELPNNKLLETRIYNTSHDYRFSYQFCFHVDQYAVDIATFDHWKNVQKITNLKHSVFDPPPGHLLSNIVSTTDPDDQVFGYFTVGSKVTKRAFTNSLKLGFPAQYFCRNGSRKPPECVDCRLFANSTGIRPLYWPF